MMPTIKWPKLAGGHVAPPVTDEIHLWRTDLDESSADDGIWFRTLSSSEQERARRFIFEEPRRRYLAARIWVRSVLGAYLNLDPQAVLLTTSGHNKPRLVARANRPGLQFNLSHSNRFVLLAVTGEGEIGVDVQEVLSDEAGTAIAGRFFTPEEMEHVHHQPPARRGMVCAEIWTRKEAAGKALGVGLTPRILSFAVGPAAWGTIDCGDGVSVWSVPFQDRFAAAVAVCRSETSQASKPS